MSCHYAAQGSLTAAAEAAAADEELANVLQWWEQAEERAVDEHAREARDAGGTQVRVLLRLLVSMNPEV